MTTATEKPLSRYDVMSMFVQRLTAEVSIQLKSAQGLDDLARQTMQRVYDLEERGITNHKMREFAIDARERATHERESAMRRSAQCGKMVHTRANDAMLDAMGFDPADFEPM